MGAMVGGTRRSARYRLAAGAALTMLAGVCQVGSAAAESAASAQSAGEVSEVVVTAEKRPTRLLETPAPVTALGAAELQRGETVRFADYAARIPGLEIVADRQGETQIIIRGITTGQMTPNSTVATYIDDAPFGSSTPFALGGQLTPDIDPSDVQQIEVLRGPQGTLYGASALGGLLKYVTTPPDLEHYGARLEVDGDEADHGGDGGGVRGMVNLPILRDTLGLRVSAYDRTDPGYISDPTLRNGFVNSAEVAGGRASVLWKPTPALSVKASVQIQNLRGAGSDDVDVDGTTLKPLYGELTQLRYVQEPIDIRYRLYSLAINYDLGFATLTSATSYGVLRENLTTDLSDTYGPLLGPLIGVPTFGVAFVTPINEDKVTQEFRIASPAEQKLAWQGGFFYTFERSSHGELFDSFNTATGTAIPVNLLSGFLLSRYVEYAGYGDLTYHVTSHFDIQGGVRYSANDQHYSQPESGLLIGPATTLIAGSSDDSTTFMVTPRYRFDDENMIYARIASGYRPGAPNALTPTEVAAGVPTAFRPDTLTDYEVGYKGEMWDKRLALDLSVFYIDWRDIQIQTVFDGFDATGNGGTARSDGVEASATLTPFRGFTLAGNVAYTDAALTQNAPGVSGVTGDRLPNVPKWALRLAPDYDFPLAPGWTGFAGGALSYLGDRASGFVSGAPAGYQRPIIPGYTTVDLHAGVIRKGWTVEVYVKNIGDERGINNLSSLAISGRSNPFEASIIQPRTVGFSLAASY